MDKYEIRIIQFTLVLIAIFLFALLRATNKYSADLPACIPYDGSYTEPKVNQLDDSLYQIYMLAQMWSFEPEEIRLPVGAEVDLYLSSKDVVHGLHIYEKNVNLMAVPGGFTKTSFKLDKPGVYEVVCHEYCGSGHQHMRGEIIVNYPNN